MIGIIKPYGAISEILLKNAYQVGRIYIVRDIANNRYEVNKKEYFKCKELLNETSNDC